MIKFNRFIVSVTKNGSSRVCLYSIFTQCLFRYGVVLLLRAAALLKLSHVRLDREQIGDIDNLDCLGPVTNLYLQKVSPVVY